MTVPDTCPKCGAALPLSTPRPAQCPTCGVYFAKLQRTATPAPSPLVFEEVPDTDDERWLWLWPAQPLTRTQWMGWCVLLAVLIVWGGWFATRSIVDGDAMHSVLHLPNLAFHEAGHVFLSPFGELLMFFGGSLLQCVVPLVVCVAFLRRGDIAGAAAGLWWCGQNLLDVAPYIADARSLSLPLIGEVNNEIVEARPLRHDWHNILDQLGWLEHDLLLARLAWLVGCVLMLTACTWLAAVLWRERE